MYSILKHLNGSKVLRAKKFSPKMFKSDKFRQLPRLGKSKIRVALSISVPSVWALKMKMTEASLEANKKNSAKWLVHKNPSCLAHQSNCFIPVSASCQHNKFALWKTDGARLLVLNETIFVNHIIHVAMITMRIFDYFPGFLSCYKITLITPTNNRNFTSAALLLVLDRKLGFIQC